MTPRLILFCFVLATFLKANVDPLAAPNLSSLTSEFFGDLALPETNESAPPFLLEADPSGLDEFDLSETISPVFLLFAIGLPRPAEAEMSLLQPSASSTPPGDPWNMWLPIGVGSMAIALIGAARTLRFRRTSARRA